MAEKGEHRIIWALTRMVSAPAQHVRGKDFLLIDNSAAKTLCANLSSSSSPAAQRRSAFASWQNKLKAALVANKLRVVQINLSVFGFSRGAAQARVFVTWRLDVCEKRGNQYFFAGMALYHSYRYKCRHEFLARKMAFANARTLQERVDLRAVQERFIWGWQTFTTRRSCQARWRGSKASSTNLLPTNWAQPSSARCSRAMINNGEMQWTMQV